LKADDEWRGNDPLPLNPTYLERGSINYLARGISKLHVGDVEKIYPGDEIFIT
jgi:hypothetical protein